MNRWRAAALTLLLLGSVGVLCSLLLPPLEPLLPALLALKLLPLILAPLISWAAAGERRPARLLLAVGAVALAVPATIPLPGSSSLPLALPALLPIAGAFLLGRGWRAGSVAAALLTTAALARLGIELAWPAHLTLASLLWGALLAAIVLLWLLHRISLDRRLLLAFTIAAPVVGTLALLAPTLAPSARFNLLMALFILLFIVVAALIASLFTFLFLKSFERLDHDFRSAYLYFLPITAAPLYLVASALAPHVPLVAEEGRRWFSLAVALDGMLLLTAVLLAGVRSGGRRLGRNDFVALVSWKFLRSQQAVLTGTSRRLLRLRELAPQPSLLPGWQIGLEVAAAAGLLAVVHRLAPLLLPVAGDQALADAGAALAVSALLTLRAVLSRGPRGWFYLPPLLLATLLAWLWQEQLLVSREGYWRYLLLVLTLLPLALALGQYAVRAWLAFQQWTDTLPRACDRRFAPPLESRIREGVGGSIFASVAGVAIGVWALIVVLSVMGGFSGEMEGRILRTKDHIMVKTAPGNERGIGDPVGAVAAVGALPGVVSARPYVEAEAMMSSHSNISATVTVRGVIPDQAGLAFLEPSLVAGSLTLLQRPEELVGFPGIDSSPVSAFSEFPGGSEPLPVPLPEEAAEQELAEAPGLLAMPSVEEDGDSGPTTASPALDGLLGRLPELPPEERELPDAPGLLAMPSVDGEEPAPTGATDRTYSGWEMAGSRALLPPVIVGQELARSLGAGIGSAITVISPDGDVGPLGVQPKARSFVVAAIFSTGMYDYDLKLAYMALPDAQRFFNLGEIVDRIDVRLARLEESEQVAAAIRQLFSGQELEVTTWQEMNRSLFSALKLERVVMFIVLGFIILIASFNIITSLVIIIRRRRAAVAILRTLGAASGEIMRIFFLLGSAAGLFGTASGVLMGLSSCGIIEKLGLTLPREYYIRSLPVQVDPGQVAMVAVAALLITGLASLYPGRIAARLLLVEGLKDER